MERLKKALRRCIKQDLSPKQREAVILYWFKGMTQEQIAKSLGIAQRSVSERLYWAHKKIYKKLSPMVGNTL